MTGTEIMAAILRASQHHFIGTLGRDPEIKYLQSGNIVANGSMAVNRLGAKQGDGQEPDWFNIEIWGEQAQQFADSCKKGDRVQVVGRVKTDRWTGQDGVAKVKLVIVAEAVSLVKPPAERAAQPAAAPAPAPAPESVSNDEIPF